METHYDQQVRDAYQQQFGKPLQTDEKSATAAFVKALAGNSVLLTHSDNDAASAIGAPDGKTDFVGLVSTAKFRDNKQGMKLGAASEGIVVLGEASEATVHGGTVRWRRRRRQRRIWRWSGAMGAERETRRGEAPMCCTAAVTDCTVHRVSLTLVTRTRRLD